jgi:group II intron reverse transcriptase/maturase
MYLHAYDRLKSKPGNMTPGVDMETLDGISLEWLNKTISQLRNGTYKFRRGRRVHIQKGSGKDTRPLTIGSPRDKIIQEVIRMVLEAIYEPLFLDSSHGFRSGYSCHTAIRFLQQEVRNPDFCIEGDISKCFDHIDQKILMRILSRKILDKRFIKTIYGFIKAGYIENYIPYTSLSGTPQGSIISPILCNIYLHELDKFVMRLKEDFETGQSKKANPDYRRIDYLAKLETNPRNKKNLLMKKFTLSSKLIDDPQFKRLWYCRYADDWVIFVVGNKENCLIIKQKIYNFLKEELNLELNQDKTKITDTRKDHVIFLGFRIGNGLLTGIRKIRVKDKWILRRVQNPHLTISIPRDRVINNLINSGYAKRRANHILAIPKFNLMPLTKDEIIALYNTILRGIYNYYKYCFNWNRFNNYVSFLLKSSCEKLLAAKFSLRSRTKVRKIFGSSLKGKDRIAFFFPPKWKVNLFPKKEVEDKLKNLYNSRGIKGLLLESNQCLICGSTEKIEMHHVKHLKDLNPKISEGEKLMMTIRRKQIPVCRKCHMKIHKQINKISSSTPK